MLQSFKSLDVRPLNTHALCPETGGTVISYSAKHPESQGPSQHRERVFRNTLSRVPSQISPSPIFPRINTRDPHKRLGISREASEEEIQAARNFLISQYAGHKPSLDAIESAYDKIILESFRARRRPKINLRGKLKKVTDSRFLKSIASRFEVPSMKVIINTAALFIVLGIWSFLNPTEEGPVLQVTFKLLPSCLMACILVFPVLILLQVDICWSVAERAYALETLKPHDGTSAPEICWYFINSVHLFYKCKAKEPFKGLLIWGWCFYWLMGVGFVPYGISDATYNYGPKEFGSDNISHILHLPVDCIYLPEIATNKI
eukprot:Gb_19808 [translate_table: standard]